MIVLSGTTTLLEAVLAGAVATNQPTYVASYLDVGRAQQTYGATAGALNSTTDVSIVPAPGSGAIRLLKSLSIYNRDTAAVIVQVHHDTAGTEREIVRITLAVGSTLVYTEAEGWRVITALGQIVEISGITELTGDVTAGPAYGSAVATVKANLKKESIRFVLENSGAALTTGLKGFYRVPFAGTLTAARLLADQSGSIVVDIWKDTYANFPPTVADTITAAAKPTIAAAVKAEDVTLTGWTTAVAEGDILAFNIDSVATVTRVEVELSITRT